MVTPTLLGTLKWKGYLIFMALNFSFIPLVYFFYPETSNLTLEEIDFLFTEDGNDGLRKFGRKAQPVQESLRPFEDIAQDAEKARASLGGDKGEHIDRIDDGSS